ncbi:MAG: ABC transporter permease subunit [Clostridia bacterium]|nr:ABC transporter permease subunit [Clostridia bacterium]
MHEAPEGDSTVYVKAPESWGTPQVKVQGPGGSSTAEFIEMQSAGDGWYYGFFPSEKNTISVLSEDGSVKGMNRATAQIGLPAEVKIVKGFIENKRPNGVFWFGTNDIGQDLWSRMWSGTRTSLFIGIVVALIEAVVGILAGLLWGYVRKLDFLFTEIYNLIDNIPSTIILMLAAYVMRPGIKTIIIAMSITGWIGLARFIRNQVLIIRDRDFNLASRCLGTPTSRVITRNLLPQMVSVVMLRMALAIPGAIGSEVFLAYIGLGLPIATPSLGNLVNKGRTMMMAPTLRYQLFIPAIILSIITICFYLVGNAFSDAADPKNHV